MKVKFSKEECKHFFVSEVSEIRAIQNDCKEIDIYDIAHSAMSVICPREHFRIFEPTAVIARNSRVSNYFTENSGNIDVWIEFVAFDSLAGCYECGVYLTDVYNIYADIDKNEFEGNMFIRHYVYECDSISHNQS